MKTISRELHSGREKAGRGWRTVDKLVSGTSMYSCEVLLVLVSGTSSTCIRYFYVFLYHVPLVLVSGTSLYSCEVLLVLVSGTSM